MEVRRRAVGGLAIALAAAVLCAPAGAGAVSPELAITNLNAQRSASGIPAGITVLPALSQGCTAHNNYMHENKLLTHEEIEGNPGFTVEGQAAGRTSVLAFGAPAWTSPLSNPFELAPIHLAQLLDPSLLVSGYDESQGYTCGVTLAPARRPEPASPVLYAYPGPNTRIYSEEEAAENPFTPGELIGLKQGTVTGPYIYLFVDGVNPFATTKARILSASLQRIAKKKKRKVKIRKIDSTNSQLGPYIPPGGMLIPVKPLQTGKYRAKVRVSAAGKTLKKTWKFRAV